MTPNVVETLGLVEMMDRVVASRAESSKMMVGGSEPLSLWASFLPCAEVGVYRWLRGGGAVAGALWEIPREA